ncbi:hypothetical protein H5410_061171 [Solanum commersonii]|uniref:Uncharacterized protein n=1 Tax=Solanum commersonii TaxID=4109 RepID=A0A9J5W711_SOLCO|nr:hypothetical protein H5410_061171 [Solanum commersonii]
MSINSEERSNNTHETENNVISRRTNNLRSKRCKKVKKVIDKGEIQSTAIYKALNQKDCIEWTVDLRAKFKEAAQQHGEGRCLPIEILEIMNVPGLTRMQVSSYLKRCKFPPVNTNNIYSTSTKQQLYHPQLQVRPHYLGSFLSGQNNDGGRLQHLHGPLFGLQGPIIGTNNSNFYMSFNSGDHHEFNLNRQTQNDYNLDLNLYCVTTNSTSAVMTDMNGGNAIINGSGEVNTNFQQ